MFSYPQFWVAVSFFLFIAAIFNPVRKLLISNLDLQINAIKSKIKDAESLKNEAQKTVSELKRREAEVEKEIKELKSSSEKRISELKILYSNKLSEQVEKRKILTTNKIDQLVRDTNNNIKHYISNVAIEATTQVLKNNLSKERKINLIKESIKDLNNILKN